MYVLPDLSLRALILAIEGDPTLFPAGATLRLNVTDFTPDKNSLIGAFTELTAVQVPGYAPTVPALAGIPVRNQDGSWEDQGTAPNAFAATGPVPAPVVVYCWYLTNAANTVLVASGRFPVPFTFTKNGDGFRLEQVLKCIQANDTDYTVTFDFEME